MVLAEEMGKQGPRNRIFQGVQKMKCWHCQTELTWGGDHDIDEENDTYQMVTNLSCPKCHSFVEVYYPNEATQKEYKEYAKNN